MGVSRTVSGCVSGTVRMYRISSVLYLRPHRSNDKDRSLPNLTEPDPSRDLLPRTSNLLKRRTKVLESCNTGTHLKIWIDCDEEVDVPPTSLRLERAKNCPDFIKFIIVGRPY